MDAATHSDITLFHGSSAIIERPVFGFGNPRNDFGLGFYCTQSVDLAKEWACSENADGFANRYSLDSEGLSTMLLCSKDFSILNWLALLVANRSLSISNPNAAAARTYLLEHFLPPVEQVDVIVGYRADDSYFTFARDFLNNAISAGQLAHAMQLGDLGKQVVLKSSAAFAALTFEGFELAEQRLYFPRKKQRDGQARRSYMDTTRSAGDTSGLFMLDILREEVRSDDPRIPRNLP